MSPVIRAVEPEACPSLTQVRHAGRSRGWQCSFGQRREQCKDGNVWSNMCSPLFPGRV